MRRPLLKASPAMLRRAMAMQAPLDRRPSIAPAKAADDQHQLDLAAVRSVPRAKNSAPGTPAQPIEREPIIQTK